MCFLLSLVFTLYQAYDSGLIPLRIDIYSADPTQRMQELLNSEDLRVIQAEWERIWFADQPSHVAAAQASSMGAVAGALIGACSPTPAAPTARPVGTWERVIQDEDGHSAKITLTIQAERLWLAMIEPSSGAGTLLCADYSVTRDSLLYGVISSMEPIRDEALGAHHMFRFCFRIDDDVLTINDFKLTKKKKENHLLNGRYKKIATTAEEPAVPALASPPKAATGMTLPSGHYLQHRRLCETHLLLTDEDEVDAAVGQLITVRGVVENAKIPTILGVDVESDDPDLRGKEAQATGVLRKLTVTLEELVRKGANMGIIAGRGPGTYYRLVKPGSDATVQVESPK